MTSEKLKPTPGPWIFHKGEFCYQSDEDDQSYGMWCPIPIELESNAQLIAEAGTVHHECGLSPRELLEAVRDMRDALKDSLDAWDCLCSVQGWDKDHLAHAPNARAALAKHKEV